jgi:hypothetical protein
MTNTREKQTELVEVINNYFGVDAAYFDVDAFTLAKQIMEAGWTKQEWIPVTERLPEKCPQPYDDKTKWCLLYTPVDGCMHIGWYTGKDYRGRDMWRTLSAMRSYQTCTKKVTHWMPLPEPPKGE